MTMNLLWSDVDGPSRYIVVDSAATHGGVPGSTVSLLGHTQHFPQTGITVEEGFQKIVRLNEVGAAVLAGRTADADALVRAFADDVQRGGPAESTMSLFASLPASADFAVTLAVARMDPPFLVVSHPERELTLVDRGHVHVEGRLEGAPRRFIEGGVRHHLVRGRPPVAPAARLTAALAIATAASIDYDLTEMGVGGAFFGAILDDAGFHWQPDITYFIYDPGFADRMPQVVQVDEGTPGWPSGLTALTCRVRDDVCVAISDVEMRGVAAGRTSDPSEIAAWMNKWGSALSKRPFAGAEYLAFVPTRPGQIVVVANDGRYVKEPTGRIALANDLVDTLNRPREHDRFGLAFLL